MEPFRIDPEKAQLLLIDLQEKMLPAVSDWEKVARNAGILIEAGKVMDVPIKYTEHYPRGLGGIVSTVAERMPSDAESFEKIHFSCCNEAGFEEFLREKGRDQVVLSGVESHICVLGTVLDLLDAGYRVAVAADACSSRNPDHHRMACEAMTSAGALVVPMETVVYHMLKRAGTEQFKTMLPFFKA